MNRFRTNFRRFFLLALLWSLLLLPVLSQETTESLKEEKEEPGLSENLPEPVSYPKFSLGGGVQMQFDDGSLRSARDGIPIRNGIGFQPADDRISLRRLRIYAKLHFSEYTSLVNETDLDPDLDPDLTDARRLELTILDLYLRHEFAPGHHLRIGQLKVPFGDEFYASSTEVTTVERSDASRQWFQRDIGIGVFGETTHHEYAVGVYQGQGQNRSEKNGTFDVAGRYVYNVNPNFSFGASAHFGNYRPDDFESDIPIRRLGIEGHYTSPSWSLDGEYLWGDGYNFFSQADTRSQGFNIYATHHLKPNLDLVFGYDRFDPDIDREVGGFTDNASSDRDRFVLGTNFYLSRKPIHRIMLNYEWRRELEGPSVSSNGFRLRYQYNW